jgi:[acyl-carrier-protein] S-malonyltransferase
MTSQVAFLFPGQGSQMVGMGQTLAQTYPAARQIFEQADDVLGFSLSKLCWQGPAEDLNDTINTQPAIFATSVASLEALRVAGFETRPVCVAGHSLGEYSAYAAAGVLTFADGLRLVRARGQLMKEADQYAPGGMAAILKLTDEQVEAICHQVWSEHETWVQVANYNSPGQVVISGEEKGIDYAIAAAQTAGARRAVKLAVSIAAHSRLMDRVAGAFEAAIDATPLALPTVPVIANITARPLSSPAEIRHEMAGQLTTPVRWSQSVQYMIDQGATHFLEIGPKDVLTGLLKRISREVVGYAVGDPEGIASVLA